jgi:hypothetical protein
MMTNEDDKEEIDSAVELRVYNGATLRTVLALRNLFFRNPFPAGVPPHSLLSRPLLRPWTTA